jgi:hypothetical protein
MSDTGKKSIYIEEDKEHEPIAESKEVEYATQGLRTEGEEEVQVDAQQYETI